MENLDNYLKNSSAFARVINAGNGGGNPWHDEKGLFTDGPSSLSTYASDKAIKSYFNEDDVKSFVGAKGNKIKTSLQTKQLDALKRMCVACDKILILTGGGSSYKKLPLKIGEAASDFSSASIRKIRNSSEEHYQYVGFPHVGKFSFGEKEYNSAIKMLEKAEKKPEMYSKEELSEYKKYLKALGTVLNTFKYIENNTPKGAANIKAALHEEKFN